MTAQPATRDFLPSLQRSATQAFTPLRRELNRLFDDLGSGWGALELGVDPRVDLRETKNAIEVTVELPGIPQQDVRVAVDDDVLTISGEKKFEQETQDENYRIAERSYGAFSRSVTLPRSIDADQIKATMKDGVLKVTAPKVAGAEGKSIQIEAA